MTLDETAAGPLGGQAQICGLAASHPPVEITSGQLMGAIGPVTPGACTNPAATGGQALAGAAAGRSSASADQKGASADTCGVAVALHSHADVTCGSPARIAASTAGAIATATSGSAGIGTAVVGRDGSGAGQAGGSGASIGLSPDGVGVTTTRTGQRSAGATAADGGVGASAHVARGTGDAGKTRSREALIGTAGSGSEAAVSAAVGAQLAGTGTPVLFVLAGLMMLSVGLGLIGRSLMGRVPN